MSQRKPFKQLKLSSFYGEHIDEMEFWHDMPHLNQGHVTSLIEDCIRYNLEFMMVNGVNGELICCYARKGNFRQR